MNNNLFGTIRISDKLYISVFSFAAFLFFIISQGASYSIVFAISAIIHELSHIIFLHLYKAKINRITIFPFGIDILCETKHLSYKKELVCTLAGSFANLLFSFVSYFILLRFPTPLLLFFVLSNLFLGIMNLIPVSFFDGGKALRLLLYDYIELDKAFYIHRSLDILSSILFVIFAVFLALLSDFNISVCAVIIYASLSNIIQSIQYNTSTKIP